MNLKSHFALAVVVRLFWGLSMVAYGLMIPRASDRGLRGILAATAGTCVGLLTVMIVLAGGTTSDYFQFVMVMPMWVAVFLPMEILAAAVAGVAAVGCGLGLMLWEGLTPPGAIVRWVSLCIMSSLFAVFATRTFRRLSDAERNATLARHSDLHRFSAVIAHEINNQLAILQNTIALLKRASADETVLAVQQDALDQMRVLTHDLVVFGEPAPGPKESVDLLNLAHAYAQALAPHIEVSTTSENATVVGNRAGIARALLNLLKNGVEAGSPVEVTIERATGGVVVSVTDHGPGVEPTVASRLGEPFFTTKARGTGLGLALVQQVVSEHDGRFSLQNRSEGGVRAELWFPEE